jgi:hypothetical protein
MFPPMMTLPKAIVRSIMERFLQRHAGRLAGVLSGFDRVLFRGTLRSLSYVAGMDKFLGSQRVLYKDFARFAESLSDRIKAQAEAIARQQQRPYEYLGSPQASKEDRARAILERDGVCSVAWSLASVTACARTRSASGCTWCGNRVSACMCTFTLWTGNSV